MGHDFRQWEGSWPPWGLPSDSRKSSMFSDDSPAGARGLACLGPPSDSRLSGSGRGVGELGVSRQRAINRSCFLDDFPADGMVAGVIGLSIRQP